MRKLLVAPALLSLMCAQIPSLASQPPFKNTAVIWTLKDHVLFSQVSNGGVTVIPVKVLVNKWIVVNGGYQLSDPVSMKCNNQSEKILTPGRWTACNIYPNSQVYLSIERYNYKNGAEGVTDVDADWN